MNRTGKKIKVFGAGSAILDTLVRVPASFPAEQHLGETGGRTLISAESMASLEKKARLASQYPVLCMAGGSAANTLCALAQYGIPCVFYGKTGSDPEGSLYRDSLQEEGCDVSAMTVSSSLPTGHCLSLITPDSERTMRTLPGAADDLHPEEIPESVFDGVTHIHTEGYLLSDSMELLNFFADQAKKHHAALSLDLSAFELVRACREKITDYLRSSVDLLFANEDEARALTGIQPETENDDPVLIMNALSDLCKGEVCLKLGTAGAMFRGKNEARDFRIAARQVNAVDTTGAGDLWQAGFLAGWLRGLPPERALWMAAETAAEVVQVQGAHLPPETWQMLRQKFQINNKQEF